MRSFRGRVFRVWMAPLMLAMLGAAQAAPPWPAGPVKLVVPFAAGGTTDLLARIVAEGLSKGLEQTVIVENKPGAGANIGAAEVARAAPDGYTLLMGTPGPLAINPYIYPKMSFDPARDFAAVSYVADVPNVILTHPASGIKDIPDLLARARREPGKLNWGSPGVGSTGHIALELLKQLAKVDISHVPYKGASQASADLLAGHIELAGDNVPTALENVRAGKLVALGVASQQEIEVLPGVRPVGQTVPGYLLPSWFVIVAPAGTPQPVVDRIAATIDAFERQPATVEKFRALGAVPVGGKPERLAAHLKAEQARYGELLKDMKGNIQQ
ncbi:tripartite tricarboxylate transporter substrate binding protein [Bordetella hinzii]|uniref:Tripartite tricarboxylate transporter substrate binding protein n=4 Tax=Bordetella hinzii TaxID=103855 RepID=A0AAN1S0P1_9BORD|nr:Tripartite tricarboxylate transporter family receptor [Bordetella hinzii]KCB44746.1 tripartite tricarboxylate transporter family receptor [Bordetella hinzii 4161]KXA73349.1 ABC transporter substrate-binding protein [Bordetella hinzii LMG 13501]AKQ59515.1 Tripartite tricarboxylate transporter family receptor [Bordetella hinzii]AZW19340.1 tripartite tricarboxylate transporter substrate binding protein [Bordetella hinzii]